MNQYRLVYSTDPKLNEQCSKCKQLLSQCTCLKEDAMPDKITVRLQIEKAKRGGKTVTVLRSLPRVESFLKELAKELKNASGSGGTYGIESEEGYVEIQGDKRDMIREILKKKNFLVKG